MVDQVDLASLQSHFPIGHVEQILERQFLQGRGIHRDRSPSMRMEIATGRFDRDK